MPEMPVIQLPSPVIIPAQVERGYTIGWLLSLTLATNGSPRKQELRGVIRPHDPVADELFPSASLDVEILIDDVWAESRRCARFAEVMAGLVSVANLYVQERAMLTQLAEATDRAADTVELESKLKELHTVMGVSE